MKRDEAPSDYTGMDIWEKAQETDPGYTRWVNQRGGYTAIDAQYHVRKATKIFGPIGKDWGYDCTHSIVDGFAVCDLKLWWVSRTNVFGPVRAMNQITVGGRVDDDAPKKALTDALTKALSHLGFSADVFLGQFDDNKYVADLRQKYAALNSDEGAKSGQQDGQDIGALKLRVWNLAKAKYTDADTAKQSIVEAAESLLGKTPDELTAAEWQRLANNYESPEGDES